MRAVVQRVASASVDVAGRRVGEIDQGLLVLLGVGPGDGREQVAWMVNKLAKLRIFADDDGKMNRSVLDVAGGVLVVSQFTLYGDVSRGQRPSFVGAAPPEVASPLVDAVAAGLEALGVSRVARGVFGADMAVRLHNDGPVTLILER